MNNSIASKKISLEILRIVSTFKWTVQTVRLSVHLGHLNWLKLKKAKTGSLKSAVESLDPAKNHLTIGRSKDFKNSKVFFTLYKLYSII